MLNELIKDYGIEFEEGLTDDEKRQEMIEYLQTKADCEQSVQGSMKYLNEIKELQKEWNTVRIKIDKARFWFLVEKNECLHPIYSETDRTSKFDARVIEQLDRDITLKVDSQVAKLFDNHKNRLRVL